jgi:hypothetical protein
MSKLRAVETGSPGSHRRPPPPLAWRLWCGLRRTLAAVWPGWGNALGIAVWLAYVIADLIGWLH